MDPYVVVSELVPDYTGTPTYVQVDAPTGYAIVVPFTHYAIKDDPQPTDRVTTYLTDGNDRIISAVFAAEEAVGGLDLDYTGYAVCVPIDAIPNGQATLVAGTVAVPYTPLTANSRVFVQRRTAGGTTAGNVYEVTARTPGTGFTITAVILATGLTGALDTSVIDWHVIEP